jgi:nucleotide-binding universal stress UspA family protein
MNKEKTLFVENRAKLKAFCTEHLGDEWQGSDISFVVEEHGSVKEAIVEKALKFDVDLIALGTKGASRVKEILLGSTTKALIRKASCAVLAVPETYDIDRFETMVYATDFEEADIFAIRRLVKIAKSFDAEIRVLHITTVNEYAGDQQMEWFKEMVQQKVDYRHLEFDLVFSDNVLKELQWYLEESDVQLLAMLERKDSTWTEKYFQPDMVRKMVSEISVPLLSFNTVGL